MTGVDADLLLRGWRPAETDYIVVSGRFWVDAHDDITKIADGRLLTMRPCGTRGDREGPGKWIATLGLTRYYTADPFHRDVIDRVNKNCEVIHV